MRKKISVWKTWLSAMNKAAIQRRSVKKVLLKISQNLQENTCARVSFLIKWKKRLWRRCFSVNFAIFFRKAFFTEHLWWLSVIHLNKIYTKFFSTVQHVYALPLIVSLRFQTYWKISENGVLKSIVHVIKHANFQL